MEDNAECEGPKDPENPGFLQKKLFFRLQSGQSPLYYDFVSLAVAAGGMKYVLGWRNWQTRMVEVHME